VDNPGRSVERLKNGRFEFLQSVVVLNPIMCSIVCCYLHVILRFQTVLAEFFTHSCFPVLVLFGFQVLDVMTCMGGISKHTTTQHILDIHTK
jgi:hypothetical protein